MDRHCGTYSLLKFNNHSFNCLLKTRVSRARDIHPDDRKSPDPLSVTKQRFSISVSHSARVTQRDGNRDYYQVYTVQYLESQN